jgi:hypothetical protein
MEANVRPAIIKCKLYLISTFDFHSTVFKANVHCSGFIEKERDGEASAFCCIIGLFKNSTSRNKLKVDLFLINFLSLLL